MLPRAFGDSLTLARQLWSLRRLAQVTPETIGPACQPADGAAPIGGRNDARADARRPEPFAGNQGQTASDRLHVVVLGAVGSGKTALINALVQHAEGTAEPIAATPGPSGPLTRAIQGTESRVWLTDTPGISGIGSDGLWDEAQAIDLAMQADLLLFVVEADLLRAEFEALDRLVAQGKRLVLVCNKKDRLAGPDLAAILDKLRARTTGLVRPEDVVAVAAAPRPVLVRIRQPNGTEESVVEYELPDLTQLDERIEAICSREADALKAGNLLLRAHRLRRAATELRNRERREQAESIVDRYQWMAAATAVAVPIPELDLIATGAVEFQMISEIAAVYGADLSPAHIRMISQQMIQTLMKRRIVESAIALVSGALKSSLIGYAAGGLVQAVTISYLTRVTGLTFLDYFERGEDWGEGGMSSAVGRQIELNGRADFLKRFLQQNLGKLRSWVTTRRRNPAGS